MAAEKMTMLVKKDSGGKKKKDSKPTTTQYGLYSGNVTDDGKTIANPTETQAAETMVKYMKNNKPESNVYRPAFSHLGLTYDRKKKQDNA